MIIRTTAPLRAQDGPEANSRRSRRAATAIATAIGAATVVGTAFAVPADAAARHHYYRVWDRVAACESSQHWHINTGNGYYGGLQFSASTWAGYHGHKYAPQASKASRAEQIEVARRVLASQGPDAWPVCGPRAGLTRNSGHATHARLPRVAGTRTQHARKHTRKHAHHAVRHHARHTHKSRTHHRDTYRVRSGDTLSAIARKLHVHGGWHALYRANRKHMSNPNVLHVGQLLRVP
jgi:nucleoid-associated protein YgaU